MAEECITIKPKICGRRFIPTIIECDENEEIIPKKVTTERTDNEEH